MVVKVNLGCGPVGKDDWVNLDWGILAFLHRYRTIETFLLKFNLFPKGYNIKWPKNLRLFNCRRKLPFTADSVDYIYASHFLEHFKKFEAERIIKDCYRVLKIGGVIRIAVPDLELLVRKYLEKDTGYFNKLYALMNFGEEGGIQDDFQLADVVMDNFYPRFYRSEPIGINRLMVYFVRPHFWMYDLESLASLARSAGFSDIQRRAFREGDVPDASSLDVFPEISLYLEAKK